MDNFWDNRYSETEYAYGETPNDFLKQQLPLLKPGKILCPAEGEGRNAVFAATLGWEVTAFDPSTEGRKKALSLSDKHNTKINYLIADYNTANFEKEYFDCICLTYAHMPASIRNQVHNKLTTYLKLGGHIILEGFTKNQINKTSGGPKNIDFLFDKNELKEDFQTLSSIQIQETDVALNEGPYHQGIASVIRLLGIK
ncbi:class I SAM-dependent methyltransferase [Draconibacterium sp. IB214405]|uniref:class I SAM-dependent methyltransferase n=1 Tax=Draconibacterium sp. IB214405 TaxID=3097352 RepID=UPI002A16AB35|nr:class I SAM-dependent methyltransferase [Draconibacterium sp. IB214405]MDX8340076.1 class I SAM-dependent methyltransferase [Draconibacterium sp. IB214405]